jgi:ParB family transcriptional regulator, chromosome partitioning protein
MALLSLDKLRDISTEDIEVADENVRKTDPQNGLPELVESIKSLGLIQPVVLLPKDGGKYKLIVGQRRLLAFRELNWPKIPALIVEQNITSDEARLISFGENNHRRKLPYSDTIAVCDYLFTKLPGSKGDKIEKIALRLNISPPTVQKYLGYKLVPPQIQALVDAGKLTPDIAFRMTVGFWPDVGMMTRVAKEMTEMTRSERERLVAARKRNPKASIQLLLEMARKPLPGVELVIHIEAETNEGLKQEAKRRRTEIDPLVNSVLEDWLEEEGSRGEK